MHSSMLPQTTSVCVGYHSVTKVLFFVVVFLSDFVRRVQSFAMYALNGAKESDKCYDSHWTEAWFPV